MKDVKASIEEERSDKRGGWRGWLVWVEVLLTADELSTNQRLDFIGV
jgi:hypothetical protein